MKTKEYQKKWRENHKKEISEYAKEYYKNHKKEKQEIIKICKSCNKEFIAKRRNTIFCSGKCGMKEYYQKNKEEILEQVKEYQKNNEEKIKVYQKEYQKNNEEKISIKAKEYNKNHKKEANKRQNNRKKTDINYRLACNLRSRLNEAIKNNYKSGSAVRDLGCSIPQLREYLESKFQPGMTWDNWSKCGWHIDHIIPLSKFNLENREELLKAVYFTNLRPLWAKDNISKGDKLE